MSETERRELLVYRVADHNGGLVFAPESRARRIDRIHRAIKGAKTWGEFRRLMPREEYEAIARSLDANGDPTPDDVEPFEAEAIPGWSDGDYPPWLQSEMGKLLDQKVLARHAVWKSTAVNGSFWWIPPDQLTNITSALESCGWRTRHAPELLFW